MQVILLEKIHHLGELGAVVKVKDGYARNFLIPQGHAKRATKAAIAEFETRRAELSSAPLISAPSASEFLSSPIYVWQSRLHEQAVNIISHRFPAVPPPAFFQAPLPVDVQAL